MLYLGDHVSNMIFRLKPYPPSFSACFDNYPFNHPSDQCPFNYPAA